MKKRGLSLGRWTQKKIIDATSMAASATSKVLRKTGEHIQKLDENHGVSDVLRQKGAKVRESVQRFDGQHGLSDKAVKAGKAASGIARKATESADRIADDAGIYDAARTAADAAAQLAKQYQMDKRLDAIGQACEDLYGASRSVIKPYFLPETPDELLQNTKKELAYISACIMQISPGEAEKLAGQFGRAIASKVAGIAASGAFLSLVSTFGTAGTGTAIASLSGAASTSATLAWVGGLLGGGMATGAVLTGGVSIVIALSAYKALSSEKRNFEDLDEVEQRIVQYCWMLIAIIDDHLQQKEVDFTAENAYTLLNDTLLPLQSLLVENRDKICQNLDKKNAAAYRQHVLKDFEPAIINPFAEFTAAGFTEKSLHYEYVIGGAIYALMTRSVVDSSMESKLVLDALRRSDNDLQNASEAELSSYLDSYDPEQLRGIANNVKGIYHELLWVEQYNSFHDTTRAEVFGATNHPGSDVRIVDVEREEVVAEYQLKATDNVAYVNEHQIKYPGVKVFVTDETAEKMEGVQASGNLNTDLTENTEENIESLAGNSLDDRVVEGVGLAATIATGQELVEMLQGRKEFPEAAKAAVKKTGTAGAATAIAAYLFS